MKKFSRPSAVRKKTALAQGASAFIYQAAYVKRRAPGVSSVKISFYTDGLKSAGTLTGCTSGELRKCGFSTSARKNHVYNSSISCMNGKGDRSSVAA